MEDIIQNCKTCEKKFLVIKKEQQFLESKGLSFPQNCPFCRQERRLKFRGNERNFYKTICEYCKKDIVTSYDPKQVNMPILCRKDYYELYQKEDTLVTIPLPDPLNAESFFNELKRLLQIAPRPPVHYENCENCDLGDHNYFCKNLLYSFDNFKTTDGTFLSDCVVTASSVDCDYAIESELCYESVSPHKCFNSDYIENCENMTNSSFCYKSSNCHDVFGCVYLQNKSFCIFNRQLTEREYRQHVEKYKKLAPEKILLMVEELKKQFPLTQTNEGHNENTEYGNYMYYNKNCYFVFDASKNENCGYLFDTAGGNNNCYDLTYSGNSQLSYEITDSTTCFNSDFIVYSGKCTDSSYIFNSFDMKNSLGCVNRNHCEYTLLNRQLTKEQYEEQDHKITSEIKEKSLGWGNLMYY